MSVCVITCLVSKRTFLPVQPVVAPGTGLFSSSSTGEAGLHGEVWLLTFAVVKRSKEGWESRASPRGEEAGLVGRYGF